MKTFDYIRPATVADAVAAAAAPRAAYLASGTNLLDLMKLGVARPDRLIDITHIAGLDRIERLPDGGMRIGALVRNADLAHDPDFFRSYPAVAEALLSGASAQLRNAATVGGNLLQQTRCAYFHDPASACNRRAPGSGCDALHGENRLHAVLGWSSSCIAVHPSDFCVPLVALDAAVEIEGRDGRREIALEALHRLPGDAPGARDRARARRPDHRTAPSCASGHLCPARALSQAARAHVLRLRGRRRRRGPHPEERQDQDRHAWRWAASRPSRGAPVRPRRSSPAELPAKPSSGAPRRRPSPKPDLPATTTSRSSWRAGSSCARSASPQRERPSASRPCPAPPSLQFPEHTVTSEIALPARCPRLRCLKRRCTSGTARTSASRSPAATAFSRSRARRATPPTITRQACFTRSLRRAASRAAA